jgi:hypothetical protein
MKALGLFAAIIAFCVLIGAISGWPFGLMAFGLVLCFFAWVFAG